MDELSGLERKKLRGLAHDFKPVVLVGKKGVTPELFNEVAQALDNHELIKIKFVECKDEKKELSQEIARGTDSENVGLIGNVAIFYRQHPDVKKRKIKL